MSGRSGLPRAGCERDPRGGVDGCAGLPHV